jgi:glycosyltransferase involved in cell wall biosynthesis
MLGYQSGPALVNYLQRARALVFAAEEDFGILPVEAQACGTPVIAFGKGGARETIVDEETGVFFDDQTPESIIAAVEHFESIRSAFDPYSIRQNAERFRIERFRQEFAELVEREWERLGGTDQANAASCNFTTRY